jgi:hypothetical protein
MFFIKDSCPVCRTGLLGIRRCTVWESPTLISTTNALDAEPPNFEVASLGIAIATGSSGWAGQEEINAKGWSSFVKGEQLSE